MKRIALALAAPLALGLAACNSSEVGASHRTGGLTEANSQEVGQQLVATLSGSAETTGKASASRSLNQGFTGGECWTEGGDLSDADGDGMPANAIYTYDGCIFTEEGWTENWSGSESYSDPLPDEADFGYGIAMDLTVGYSEDTGTYAENDSQATFIPFSPPSRSDNNEPARRPGSPPCPATGCRSR